MIRTNELAIGDYVGFLPTWKNEDGALQSEDNPKNYKIYKVEMLNGSGAHIYNVEYSFYADDIELYPIPLTPEILEKSGFKDSGFFGELLYKDWQIMSDCHQLAARCGDGWLIDIPCEFIHQLQHALRICKIDKTIEL